MIASEPPRYPLFGEVFQLLRQHQAKLFAQPTLADRLRVRGRFTQPVTAREESVRGATRRVRVRWSLEDLDADERTWLLGAVAAAIVRVGAGDLFDLLINELAEHEQAFLWRDDGCLELHLLHLQYAQTGLGSLLVQRARRLLASSPIRQQASGWSPTNLTTAIHFSTLAGLEAAWLESSAEFGPSHGLPKPDVDAPGGAREPRVKRPMRDYFGLALSGGGVRSATFNLGLLQALGEKKVLEHVDYLSTVSGGGYIGGFWTAWRRKQQRDGAFPIRRVGAGANELEPAEVRHLRQFSRFLIPRFGFGEAETWNAIVVVLGGTIMSLGATTAAVALAIYAWYFSLYGLSALPSWQGGAAFAATTFLYHWASELRTMRLGKLGEVSIAGGLVAGACSALLSFVAWVMLFGWSRKGWFCPITWQAWTTAACRSELGGPGKWCPLTPGLVWGSVAVALLLTRGIGVRFVTDRRLLAFTTGLDRAVSRCLTPAVVAAALTMVWAAAEQVQGSLQSTGVVSVSASAAVLFVAFRDWLKEPLTETRGSALTARLLKGLKPLLPQLAALVAVLLFMLAVASGVRHFGFSNEQSPPTIEQSAAGKRQPRSAKEVHAEQVDVEDARTGFIVAVGVFVAALFLFDPARVGLHGFYRARIARCFLGAARVGHSNSAPATTEQEQDDCTLAELRNMDKGLGRRPLHLVCCAANNLNGDVLASLYRGASSAVLSPFGVSVGNYSAPFDRLPLSAALTASAAAFNSQMGSLSMRLGPAVAFLMCALNLRLGLWVPHPLNSAAQSNLIPGLYFFMEALGVSRSDQVSERDFNECEGSNDYARKANKLHLSDGGHFENLGLYELIRRHCRYIIVSDATCDPDDTFGDLGNAIRRVREDFGVEIELDLAPLKKREDGFVKQHIVTGTVHFDGLDGTDKGLLIYFKPALTGDEPSDVLEHRARNPSFPHDGTGDQFYDESQWESYRRLGQHAASAILALPDKKLSGNFVDKLFMLASQRWQPRDERREESFQRLTERSEALEADIAANAPLSLRIEFFPEVAAAIRFVPANPAAPISATDSANETTRIVYFIMRVAQLMEDVWLNVDLDLRWANPSNEGWMNYFQRWASVPSFRTWWPILRPLYEPRFRDFVNARFDLHLNEPARGEHGEGGRLTLKPASSTQLPTEAPALLEAVGKPDAHVLIYELELQASQAHYLAPIAVGFLVYEASQDGVEWDSSTFYVSPSLAGAGISARLLDAALTYFSKVARVRVKLDSGVRLRSPASRRELVQQVAFYKSRGFHYEAGNDGSLVRFNNGRA